MDKKIHWLIYCSLETRKTALQICCVGLSFDQEWKEPFADGPGQGQVGRVEGGQNVELALGNTFSPECERAAFSPKDEEGKYRFLFLFVWKQATTMAQRFYIFVCLLFTGIKTDILNHVIKVIKQGYFKKHGLCKMRLPWEWLTIIQSQGNY